ncbi:hypothetical protein BD769DRAFT_1648631 [Suillus cothurnatus]|nr:hypothetical protein BD769DRAFT_1648631 [Suillus cothurnatus]
MVIVGIVSHLAVIAPTMSEDQHSCSQCHKLVDALQLGPRKRPSAMDPLVHYGPLLTNRILWMGELADILEENFTAKEQPKHCVFQELLKSVAGLEEHLMQGRDDEVDIIAELLTKGSSGARGDNTTSLKGSVLDWITLKGQNFIPPLTCNVKVDQGFHYEWTGALLCSAGLNWSNSEMKAKLKSGEIIVTGDQWPLFLYADYHYDPKEPWNGLFRSALLVCALRHIDMSLRSPSSMDREPKATHSGNARIHGMTRVTLPSIAYIAMQIQFMLTSSPVFSYIFEDPDEKQEVDDLTVWWNRQIFPSYSTTQCPLVKNSVLAMIWEKRT